MTTPSAEDLSGLWHGQYSYPTAKAPVPFVATLLDAGGALSGSITEKSTLPPRAGEVLYATVAGQREGACVRFIKSYESDDPRYQTVAYDGQVSGDGSEIEGIWNIRGWQGRFLMIRGTSRGVAAVTGVLETAK